MGVGLAYVYLSPAPVGLVPPGLVTVTSTVPAPAGVTAVREVFDTTVKFVAAVAPNSNRVHPGEVRARDSHGRAPSGRAGARREDVTVGPFV